MNFPKDFLIYVYSELTYLGKALFLLYLILSQTDMSIKHFFCDYDGTYIYFKKF